MKLEKLTGKQLMSISYLIVCLLVLIYLLLFTERSNVWVAVGLFTVQAAILVYLNVLDSSQKKDV